MSEESPDKERVQKRAKDRQADRADGAESVLEGLEERFDDEAYPISSEELAVEYGSDPIDIPNETESLGSVFDRLVDEEYDSPEAVREAVYGEITGGAGDRTEANPERPLESLDETSADPVE